MKKLLFLVVLAFAVGLYAAPGITVELKYNLDIAHAELIYYESDTIVISQTTYDTGFVHIPAVADTLKWAWDDALRIFERVQIWVSEISSKFGVRNTPVSLIDYRLRQNANQVRMTTDIGGSEVMDIRWYASTDTVTIMPSTEQTLDWGDFMEWHFIRNRFYEAVHNWKQNQ